MTDEQLTKIVDRCADASGWCGLDSSTMYGEFALDVAKSVREECAKLCDDISDKYERREGHRYPELKSDAQTCAADCAYAIRGA